MDIFSTMRRTLQESPPRTAPTEVTHGCPESFLEPFLVALQFGTPKSNPGQISGLMDDRVQRSIGRVYEDR